MEIAKTMNEIGRNCTELWQMRLRRRKMVT